METLLSLKGERITVWKRNDSKIIVSYDDAEVKDGLFLISLYGEGDTVNEAAKNYFKKIRGKTLVFRACSNERKEVTVL